MLYIGLSVHEIMVPLAHATSEGSDEPAHPHSLARHICSHTRNVDEGACLKLGLHRNNCLLSDKKKWSKKPLVYRPCIFKFAT